MATIGASTARVIGITGVERRQNGLKVSGVIDSGMSHRGAYGDQGYDPRYGNQGYDPRYANQGYPSQYGNQLMASNARSPTFASPAGSISAVMCRTSISSATWPLAAAIKR